MPCYLYIQDIFLSLIDSLSLNLARILQSSICWNVLQNSFSDGSNDLQSKIKWTASALATIYTWTLPHWVFQMQLTFSHSQIKFNSASGPYVFDVRIMKKNSKSQSPYIYKIYLWFRHNKKQSKITKFRCVWCQDNEIAIRLERQKFQIFAVMSGREKNGEAKLYPHILGKPKPLQDEPWQRRNLSISMQ